MNIIDQIKAWWRGPDEPELYLNAPSWSFAEIWNQSLLDRPERVPRPRDYVWASEIGGSMIDRYLRMTGTPFTNAPNDRSLRKFQAADIWEWIVGFVLKRSGVWISTQEKVFYQYPGLLSVTGKLDHLAGGKPDWKKATKEVRLVGFPPMIENASLAIIEQLSNRFGNDPLRTIVLEVKSLGSNVFGRYEATGKADPRHQGQIFHYLKAKNLPEGHFVYVCRDDCRIVETQVLNPSDEAEKHYRNDLEEITDYIKKKQRPALEKEVLFDDVKFKFQLNWKVEYSSYLTLLYGYKEPIFYREQWEKTVAQFNRTFKRCVTNAKMTDLNLKTIEIAQRAFPEWPELIKRAQIAAAKNPDIVKDEEEAEAA